MFIIPAFPGPAQKQSSGGLSLMALRYRPPPPQDPPAVHVLWVNRGTDWGPGTNSGKKSSRGAPRPLHIDRVSGSDRENRYPPTAGFPVLSLGSPSVVTAENQLHLFLSPHLNQMKKRHLQPVTRLTPQTQGQSSEHPFFPQRTVLLPSHLTRCLCERQSVLPCGSDRPSPATAGRATGNTEAVSQNYTHATATCKGNEGDQDSALESGKGGCGAGLYIYRAFPQSFGDQLSRILKNVHRNTCFSRENRLKVLELWP
ncbi:hypothetical protein CB1_000390037 [Camelus ferus]|nr:hypothetical protein CB1_000390037 [Camelus ferus]